MIGFSLHAVLQALPFLLSGLRFSLEMTAVGVAGGLAFGIVLAVVRQMDVPMLAQMAAVYVTLLRAIPLLMVLFWFFFLVPLVLGWLSGSGPIPIGGRMTAYITFVMFEAAYYAEIIRAGLNAIGRGQYEAASALGLHRVVTYRLVILPQVLRAVTPIVLNQAIILFQDTSLVYVMSLTDLLGAASKIAERDGTPVEMYLTAAVIYFVISFLASQAVQSLRRRIAVA